MPKYDIELTFYRTVEAKDIDEAEAIADYEKGRLVNNGLAGDLGWEGAATRIALKSGKGK